MQKINPTPVEVKRSVEKPTGTVAPIVKRIEPMKQKKVTVNLPLVIIALAIVAAGGFTGFVLAQGGSTSKSTQSAGVGGSTLKKVVGADDEKTFKDSAEGVLTEGGVENEGTHHLERPGGVSQNVYLTSSNIPLDDYLGKKVKVWGETFGAEKAGWLMDVGRLELLE